MSTQLPALDASVVRAAARSGRFLRREPEAARRIGPALPAVGHLRPVLLSPASPGRPRISTSSASPATRPRSSSFFKARGYRIDIEDERWIGKVWKGEHFFDVIYNISTASIPITDEWFREAYEVEVYGTNVRITPPTEFILSKLFLQDRYRYDGADVAHVILKKHDEIDWR